MPVSMFSLAHHAQNRLASSCVGRWLVVLLIECAVLAVTSPAWAEAVGVRHQEGLVHGFLAIRTLDGKRIADGEITQIADGDSIRSHLVFHFTDGSLYEEEATFTQRGTFRLRTDHLVQKGPSFKRRLESFIDATSGRVKLRYTDDDGKEKSIDESMRLPEDLANGLLFTLLRHIDPGKPQTIVPELALTPKPRLVTLVITPRGEESFTTGHTRHQATHYVVKVKIGGIAGWFAGLLGKQPPDIHVWIMRGEAPAFIKFEGPVATGGPVWRVELADSARFG